MQHKSNLVKKNTNSNNLFKLFKKKQSNNNLSLNKKGKDSQVIEVENGWKETIELKKSLINHCNEIESKLNEMLVIINKDKIAVTNTDIIKNNNEINKISIDIINLIKQTIQKIKYHQDQLNNVKSNDCSSEKQTQSIICQQFSEKVNVLYQTFKNQKKQYEVHKNETQLRALRIKYPNVTEEQRQEMLKTMENNDNLFFSQYDLLYHEKAKDRIQYEQERLKEVLKIEKSIREIHQLFTDVSILVLDQGKMIDSIEAHVKASKRYVSRGNNELHTAKERSRSGICHIL